MRDKNSFHFGVKRVNKELKEDFTKVIIRRRRRRSLSKAALTQVRDHKGTIKNDFSQHRPDGFAVLTYLLLLVSFRL